MFAERYCQPGTGKTPHLGTGIWQICTLPGSPVRVCPQPSSVDEQGPLVGMTLRALLGGSSSAKSLVLVVVSPSPTLPQSFSPSDGALTFPCSPRGGGLEWGLLQSDPQHWLLFVPPEFSFPTGDLSVCSTGLGVGQRGQHVAASLTLTLLMRSFLVPKVQGMLQPHPCVLEFSQWCLILQQICCCGEGREVRNRKGTSGGQLGFDSQWPRLPSW